MRDRAFRIRQLLGGLATFLLAGVLAAPLDAQELGNRKDTEQLFSSKYKERFNKLRDGEEKVDPVKDRDLLEVGSQYFVYRVTWLALQAERYAAGMGRVQDDFSKELMNHKATLDGKNKEFMKLLAPELIKRFKEVFQQDIKSRSTAVTNAALMLPVLAKCKQTVVHDFLLELLTKPDASGKPVHPYIRMCAIKGLGELNAPGGPQLDDRFNPNAVAAKRARELARLEAIVHFIELPYPLEGSGKDYDEAFTFVRREGVKALAQLQLPAYEINKDGVKGPVAYLLLKIASGSPVKDGPPFTLSEKVEAALGLCQLKAGETPPYNAELAAYVLGNVLLDFASAYKTDYLYFSVKEKDKDAPSRLTALPWKFYALRLEAGLDAMYANLPKGSPATKSVDGLRTKVKTLLVNIANLRTIEINPDLPNFVASLRPQMTEIYQGSKGFTLPLGEK